MPTSSRKRNYVQRNDDKSKEMPNQGERMDLQDISSKRKTMKSVTCDKEKQEISKTKSCSRKSN